MKKSLVLAILVVVALLAFSCGYVPDPVMVPAISGIKGRVIIEGVEDLSMCSIIAERQINGETVSVVKEIGLDKKSPDLIQISSDAQAKTLRSLARNSSANIPSSVGM